MRLPAGLFTFREGISNALSSLFCISFWFSSCKVSSEMRSWRDSLASVSLWIYSWLYLIKISCCSLSFKCFSWISLISWVRSCIFAFDSIISIWSWDSSLLAFFLSPFTLSNCDLAFSCSFLKRAMLLLLSTSLIMRSRFSNFSK